MRKFVMVLAVVALVGSASIAASADRGSADQAGRQTRIRGPEQEGVRTCHGGKQKLVKNKLSDAPYIFGEGPFTVVPGSAVSFSVPAGQQDTVLVTFSAEAQLRGSSELFDWIEIEIRLDGVPMEPFDLGTPTALQGGPTYVSASLQRCQRVGEGNHVVSAHVMLTDNGADEVLTGWVDDWLLSVEVND